jgi:hypothetical protein
MESLGVQVYIPWGYIQSAFTNTAQIKASEFEEKSV